MHRSGIKKILQRSAKIKKIRSTGSTVVPRSHPGTPSSALGWQLFLEEAMCFYFWQYW